MSHQYTTQYDDIIIYATALGALTSAPDLVAFNGAGSILAYGFNGTSAPTTEQVYGSFEIPHDYKEGSDLQVHVHWCPTTATNSTVAWFFEYSKANPVATFSVNATQSTGLVSAGGTAWSHKLTNMTQVISGTGMTIGNVIAFRFYRDNTVDEYPDDAILLSIGIHYQKDSFGSNQMTSKN